MRYSHTPVLPKEVLENLALKPNQNVIDSTLGGGGHAKVILEKTGPDGFLLGIDLREDSLKRAEENLKQFAGRYKLVQDNFKNLKQVVNKVEYEQRKLGKFSAILSDLGLALYQFKERGQGGFSFLEEEELDMRLDKSSPLTASQIVNHWPEDRLYQIFKKYGEEKYARGIARAIVQKRKQKQISNTRELASLIENFYHGKRSFSKLHPARLVFQALRIAVNDELENLKIFLKDSLEILGKGARIVIISYHSGEDKIVKEFFKKEAKGCICPPEFPVCQCGHLARLKIITKKPIVPQEKEIRENPASRSAKLRVAEVI